MNETDFDLWREVLAEREWHDEAERGWADAQAKVSHEYTLPPDYNFAECPECGKEGSIEVGDYLCLGCRKALVMA